MLLFKETKRLNAEYLHKKPITINKNARAINNVDDQVGSFIARLSIKVIARNRTAIRNQPKESRTGDLFIFSLIPMIQIPPQFFHSVI